MIYYRVNSYPKLKNDENNGSTGWINNRYIRRPRTERIHLFKVYNIPGLLLVLLQLSVYSQYPSFIKAENFRRVHWTLTVSESK